ncbi:MAG TPA: ATP-grasp domain-containing protein [Pirellulales bacterium]|nr:ATP-grasp domain-containing protein [Pirellulales bacterium]
MTAIFVYEFLTGGGLLNGASARETPASLLAEGRSMASALAADLVALGFVTAVAMRDRRLVAWQPGASRVVDVSDGAEHAAAFDRLAADADWTVVIAPEIGGALAERCRRVAAVGGRLLGPQRSLVELASDKHATAEFLDAAGVPVPRGILFQAGAAWPREFRYPAVWKPRDGAGSHGVVYVSNSDAPLLAPDDSPGRLERFCPGLPTSVAFLCGPGGLRLALPACRQRISDDGRFRYLGGNLPLSPELALRAAIVADRAVSVLPGAFGYLGIDLVLGESADGADDVVIEINPRLTTSYIGLRAAVEQNLAGAMLSVARAFAPPRPFKVRRAVQFDADGSVRG